MKKCHVHVHVHVHVHDRDGNIWKHTPTDTHTYMMKALVMERRKYGKRTERDRARVWKRNGMGVPGALGLGI